MRYRIEHETVLNFEAPVQEHHCELRVAPRADSRQEILNFQVDVDPPAEIFEYQDAFGNRVHHFGVAAPHKRLVTRVTSEVEATLDNPFGYRLLDAEVEPAWYESCLAQEPLLWSYVLHESPSTPRLATLDLKKLKVPARDTKQSIQISVLAAMEWVGKVLKYQSGVTHTHSPLADALKARAGVCQDFAHLMISVIRSWGVPVRYVMGYLDPGVSGQDSPNLQATHAWVEVLLPGAGWRGFDATHQLAANQSYVAVAVGRDSMDAAPQRGTFKGDPAGQSPTIKLQIARQGQ